MKRQCTVASMTLTCYDPKTKSLDTREGVQIIYFGGNPSEAIKDYGDSQSVTVMDYTINSRQEAHATLSDKDYLAHAKLHIPERRVK